MLYLPNLSKYEHYQNNSITRASEIMAKCALLKRSTKQLIFI
jgi:hypothetical protein